ncbi:MAG: hypothetical protein ACTSU5_19005 [Promethearchaeota archaeon]
MPIDVDELIRVLPKLIKENDAVLGAIVSALSGVVATHEDVLSVIREMHERFEAQTREMNERFERVDERFERVDERFEKVDERFEAQTREMNERFERVDERFEAQTREMNERFEKVDERFERVDERFDSLEREVRDGFRSVNGKLDSLLQAFGKPFEVFGQNVVLRVLEAEGVTGVKLERKVYKNADKTVFKHGEVELDGVSEDPPVVVEVTTVLRDEDKVEKFLAKKQFLEELLGKQFRGFLVAATTELDRERLADLVVKMKRENAELINL